MTAVKLELEKSQLLTNTDFAWIGRLINAKLSDKLLDYERQELSDLQAKLYSLDTAIVMARGRR